MKVLLVLITLTLISFTLTGQGNCNSCTVYKGYIASDIEMWKKGMEEASVTWLKDPSSCTLYTLTEARYGYIGYLLGNGNKEEARPIIVDFEKDVCQLAAFADRKVEAEAFMIALLGFRMELNPARAMSLGPKALKQLEKAIETGGDNPAVWIERANSEASMPAFVGGSKVKAVESYRYAISLFELKRESLGCNWRYLNTYLLLGKVLEQTGDYKGACDTYRKVLQEEPEFLEVRINLLPAAEKKITE
ncbi:MAG TPA: hypothetical protein VLQ76_07200, partial [Bacteroidales bacterium]|nr:hypothetical protein [Bacteroidales bacterium]